MKLLLTLCLLASPAFAFEPLTMSEMGEMSIPTSQGFVLPSSANSPQSYQAESKASASSPAPLFSTSMVSGQTTDERSPVDIALDIRDYGTGETFEDLLEDAFALYAASTGIAFDLAIEGVAYEGTSVSSVTAGGAIILAVPSRIDRISVENIRVQGSARPPIGSVYISDVKLTNSSIVVTPH